MTSGLTALVDVAQAADLTNTGIDVAGVLRTLVTHAEDAQPASVGFPGATDIDYTPLVSMLGNRLWNNIGDPDTAPGGAAHTMLLEQSVITWCADVFAMPADDRWGYTTTGGTEGNLAALYAARRRHPDAVTYYSRTAHYSIQKVLDILGIPDHDRVVVAVDSGGRMDCRHFKELVTARAGRPSIVIATAGTTMVEATDDFTMIRDVLTNAGVHSFHLHVDAALQGIPLGLDGTLQLNDTSGIDSVALSGHKFFGTPVPCGLVLMRSRARGPAQHIAYTATSDTTITGSRNGAAAAMLWYAIATYGIDGHRQRAQAARDLAAYTVTQLNHLGWPAWRNPNAFTVVLATPPAAILKKWLLASEGDISHIICMPGITHNHINNFISDLGASQGVAQIPKPRHEMRS